MKAPANNPMVPTVNIKKSKINSDLYCFLSIVSKSLIIYKMGIKGWIKGFDDETYLKLMYWAKMGKKLNLDNPVTFNEKLQWLKLHNQNPEYSKMVDKYEAKKWVAERIGDEYIIPTLGVWDSFDEIDFNQLPNQFVLKCTHDSGGLVICKDKNHFDKAKARKKIEASLKRNYFLVGREYPYKAVKPRIIAEQYMEDTATRELRDYKIFTFDGIAKALFISWKKCPTTTNIQAITFTSSTHFSLVLAAICLLMLFFLMCSTLFHYLCSDEALPMYCS